MSFTVNVCENWEARPALSILHDNESKQFTLYYYSVVTDKNYSPSPKKNKNENVFII